MPQIPKSSKILQPMILNLVINLKSAKFLKCVYVLCMCLHDRRCGDMVVNAHQSCGVIWNCANFTWSPQ